MGHILEDELVAAQGLQRNGTSLVLPDRWSVWVLHVINKLENPLLFNRQHQKLRLFSILLVLGSLAGGGVVLNGTDRPCLALPFVEEARNRRLHDGGVGCEKERCETGQQPR